MKREIKPSREKWDKADWDLIEKVAKELGADILRFRHECLSNQREYIETKRGIWISIYDYIAQEATKRYGPFRLPAIRGHTNDAVIRNYFYAKPRTIYNCNSTGSLRFEDTKLYSYSFYVLCVRAKNCFVVNADVISISTAMHQSLAIGAAPENTPQIPYSALDAADIDPEEIELIQKTEDTWQERTVRDPKTGELKIVQVHFLGSALFKANSGGYYLSALDWVGRRYPEYFLVELPKKATSVQEAYRILAPLNSEEWERYQIGEIKRQGEFFFIPAYESWKAIKKALNLEGKKQILKHVKLNELFNNPNGNPHIATRCIVTEQGTFVSGTVRHPQHKMLRLGDAWYEVRINTAKRSFTAAGRVD